MLSNLVSRVSTLVQSTTSTVFPYTVGEEIFDNNVYQMFEGTKNGTDEKVTIFAVNNRKNARQNRVDAAINCFNELKRIRHPNILSFMDGTVTDDKIMFVTEYVYPLQLCIDNNSNNNSNNNKIVEHKINESFIILCLYQISSALSFIHNELNTSHCLVLPSSIFITKGGNFVLGGMELSHIHKNPPNHFLTNFDLLPNKYRPKELSTRELSDVINIFIKNSINFLDSWCVGCLIYELFQNFNRENKKLSFNKPQQLSNLNQIPCNLQSYYKRLLATKPSSRITLKSLLKCDFIQQNSLVQTDKFLTEIAIKSDSEKQQFLKYLNSNIESYPSTVCKYRVLPVLEHLLSHGFGSNGIILSLVIKIGDGSSSSTEIILSLFNNNERSTRINLLKSLPLYIENIEKNIINDNIWPKLINGFTDSSPILREQSVRSIIHFAPCLSASIIDGELLPLLNKISCSDIEPAIRTNCCIVLGKIAKYCDINNNKQNELLFVNCFNRALNDKFIPARNAALNSFISTISLFNTNIIANKILPIIIKYTCDPYKSVRDSSFKCIQIGLEKLKQHSLTLPDQSDNNNNNNKSSISSTNNNDNDNLDDIFNNNNNNNNNHNNVLKKEEKQNHTKTKTKKEQQSLDDFFDSLEMNKQTTTKVKYKTKNNTKSKSKSMKKKKKKVKKKKKKMMMMTFLMIGKIVTVNRKKNVDIYLR